MKLLFQPFSVYDKVLHLPNPCHMTKKAQIKDKGKLAISLEIFQEDLHPHLIVTSAKVLK